MTLNVIGTGFGRTGTDSMRAALDGSRRSRLANARQ